MKTHTVKKYSVENMMPGAALAKMGSGKAKVREPHMIDTKWNCGHDGAASPAKRKGY